MSTETNNNSNIWNYIGKAGVIVALAWGSIQIFNYFFKIDDYDAVTSGKNSFYETAPLFKNEFFKSIENKALVKAEIKKEGVLRTFNLDTLVLKYKDNYEFDHYKEELNPFQKVWSWQGDYLSFWTFKIKNEGNKPLEELALELPFKGYYKIINNNPKSNSFTNKIELGELRPSYEIEIYCWSYDFYDIQGEQEKSRFTHKNGWFRIDYPIEVNGILAWNLRNDNNPLFFATLIIVILIMILYGYAELRGFNKGKQEALNEKNSEVPQDSQIMIP